MEKTTHEELIKRGREIILHSGVVYVDVDIEADGIAGFGSILSLGAVTAAGEEFYEELKPLSGPYIAENREFCERNGLNYNKLKKEAKYPKKVFAEFGEWLNHIKQKSNKNLIMVGYNAGFDKSFIDLYFTKFKILNPFETSPLDLMSLILPTVPEWNFNLTHKNSLPDIIQVNRVFSHHALEDAKYQQELHFALVGWYSLH